MCISDWGWEANADGVPEAAAAPAPDLSFLDETCLLTELLLPLPTFREVPRAAQLPLAELTGSLCSAAASAAADSPEAEQAWKLLLLHHRLLLWAPAAERAAGRARRRAQQELVLDRLGRAVRGDWEGLLEEAQAAAAAARARRAGAAASTGLAGAALAGEVIRRVSLGELSRAAQLLGQAKVAAPSPKVRDELQSLLVTLAAERGLLPADHSSDEEVPARDLATALRRAPRSSCLLYTSPSPRDKRGSGLAAWGG